MTTLITGASGFLGAALTRRLIAHGLRVRVLVRDGVRARAQFGDSVEIVCGSITDAVTVRQAVAGSELIYHLAGQLYHPATPPEIYNQTHVEGTRTLLEACREQGQVRRLVHCGTTGVYGVTGLAPASEDTPYAPTNPYEASKLKGELLALSAWQEWGLPVCIARPGLVYGPGDLHLLGLFKSIERGVFRVLARGTAHLHPIYIEDLVTAFQLCADLPVAVGRCYNLASERSVAIRALATSIAHALDRELPRGSIPLWLANLIADGCTLIPALRGEKAPLTRSRIDFLTHSRVYDIGRAKAELGFQPRVTLEAGLKQTVDWYRQQGHLTA